MKKASPYYAYGEMGPTTRALLQDLLKDGPVRSKVIYALALSHWDVSESTLWRASRDLGIESYRQSGRWWWALPIEKEDQ